jgi:hypothetical protein
VIPLDGDPICQATDAGRRCERWAQPAAHVDGVHQAGQHRWPVGARLEQMTLDLELAS